LQEKKGKEIKYMATGRMTKKVLDHISNINKENKEKELSKNLKKEVNTGANGTQSYVIKKGINKNKLATKDINGS
jgi:translation initiation factor 1 (eIF-1/SUI1)